MEDSRRRKAGKARPLVLTLPAAGRLLGSEEVPFPETSLEHFDRQPIALLRQHWIVAWTLITEEGVRRVEFMPLEERARGLECRMHDEASFERDMGVLPAPDH